MLLRLADLPLELVVKIIDLLPHEDVGCITDVNDYAFEQYYTDVLIISGDWYSSPHLASFCEPETSFGNLHDSSPMTKFDRVEFFIEFVKKSGSRYIPKNLSFESPYDFLIFGKHFPDVLNRALKTSISFENYLHQLQHIDLRDYRATSLTCDNFENLVFPVACNTIDTLTINYTDMENLREVFSKFQNLQSLECYCLTGNSLRGLQYLPKTLKVFRISFYVSLSSDLELDMPNLERLVLEGIRETGIAYDFSNMTKLDYVELCWLKIRSLEVLNLPRNLRTLRCKDLGGMTDFSSIKDMVNLENLTFRPNIHNKRFAFPARLKSLSIKYFDMSDRIGYQACQNKLNEQLEKGNFSLPPSLLHFRIKSMHMSGHYIPQIELPNSLHSLTIEELEVRDFQSWRFPKSLWDVKFSHCEIQSVDGTEWPYNLTTLDLSANKIPSIGGLQYLKFLKYLHLQENRITSIDCLPSCLEYLDLSNNCLKSFHGSGINSLRDLILNENDFEGVLSDRMLTLPEGLQVLKLSRNKLTQVDKWFKFPAGLKTLSCDASHFGEQSTFSDAGRKSLWSLSLGQFPCETTSMQDDGKLGVQEPYHKSLKFKLCSNLLEIFLKGVPIKMVDWEVYPETLTKLEATYCGIQELRGDLRRLSKLYTLELHNNQLNEWVRKNELVLPDSLRILTLCDNGLTKIAGIRTGTSPRFELDICGNEELDAETFAILRHDLPSNTSFNYRIFYEFRLVYVGERLDNLVKLLDEGTLQRKCDCYDVFEILEPDIDTEDAIGLAEEAILLE